MGVLGESWCFCSGAGRSEKMKGSIFGSKGPAMATVCGGTGFLIHRALLLTTHGNLPSVSAADGVEIQFQSHITAKLVPHRFFTTSSVLDLTVVGFDIVDGDTAAHGSHPHYLRTCSNPCLDLGSMVYLLGHTDKKDLTVGEGKVVIATDNLIKLSTDGITWSPGSAGFDVQGNLAFMVCDPMKLASSPSAKSSSTSSSSSSWKKDLPMQFGIPIPIICDWLNQQWEGSLDEFSKPKIPLIRLMSTGQKSDHSSVSFTLRRVFKSTEGEDDDASPSHIISRPINNPGSSSAAISNPCQKESQLEDLHSSNTHEQGIPTPEIYESPRMTAGPIRKKENAQLQLLDINFPPKGPRAIVLPAAIKERNHSTGQNMLTGTYKNVAGKPTCKKLSREEEYVQQSSSGSPEGYDGIVPVESVTENCSEVQSSSSPLEVSELQDDRDGLLADYSSEGETMYSAETMESRNYSSPREDKFQQVRRSQSCVSYSRWGATFRNSTGQEKQQSFIQGRKMYSQAVSHRGNDYFSPTVSSIMKKRNSSEQLSRPRSSTVQLSPRWMF